MFSGLGNFANLLKSAQQMGAKMQDMAAELKRRRVTGASGGGMVTVESTGDQEILAVRIDPSLVGGGDRELLEDLVRSAVNQALTKANEARAELMQSMASDTNIPGLAQALQSMGGPAFDPGGSASK